MSSTQESQAVRGIIRQGDVLLVPLDAIPRRSHELVTEGPRVVLAEGEATGHAHVVQGRARLVRSTRHHQHPGETYLVVSGPATLVHEEHDRIELATGAYEVRRQREYVPPAPRRRESFRWVAD